MTESHGPGEKKKKNNAFIIDDIPAMTDPKGNFFHALKIRISRFYCIYNTYLSSQGLLIKSGSGTRKFNNTDGTA